MTTTAPTRGSSKSILVSPSPDPLPPTHGPLVCRWMETFLIHGPGPVYGQPFRLQSFQKAFLYRLYEHDGNGRRRVRRALFGLPKGNAKTELMAAVALAELAGPLATTAPDIPVAAASYEQADILFATAAAMVKDGPLKDHLDVFEDRITRKDGPGRLKKVAAVAGTNDGGRPTTFVGDELHEWDGRKARVHLVISNSLQKRPDGLELNISTAGSDPDSLLATMYEYGRKVASGEVVDPEFLFVWYEGPAEVDLNDPDSVRAAVLACNPGADVFWPAENLVKRARQIPAHEFRRYHLNQWVSGAQAFLPPGVWDACAHLERRRETADEPCTVPAGADVVAAFDGSYSGDSTGITVHELGTRHMDVWAAWERPADARHDWHVPEEAVEAALRELFRTFKVRELAADMWLYRGMLERLDAEGFPVTEVPQGKVMNLAAQSFYEAATGGAFTHSGDPRLSRHVANAVVDDTPHGPRVRKESKNSKRKIDLAICAIIGDSRAAAIQPEPEQFFGAWR